jgi:adenylate kinase family enzyme
VTGHAERIYVIGLSGTGKSTLGRRLGEAVHLPVYHLDDIARPERRRGDDPAASGDRTAATNEIAATERWIAEGIHVGWTDPLLERAQLIIWLDNVSPGKARVRLVRRFVSQALAEARRRKGRDRYFRVRDYARELRALVAHLQTVSGQRHAAEAGEPAAETRAAIQHALEPHLDRVVRCSSESEIEAVVQHLRASTSADNAPGS